MTVTALTFALALTLQAGDAADRYRACAELADDAERLACFDAAADEDDVLQASIAARAEAAALLAEAKREAAEAEARARAAEARLAALEERAGVAASGSAAMSAAAAVPEPPRRKDRERPDRFEAEVVRLAFAPRGELIVTLDNGETWTQLSSDSRTITRAQADRIERVAVRPGAFGSHWMKLEPLGRSIRVKPEGE